MRLFAKYNRINLLATILVFIFSGFVFYFFIHLILVSDVVEDLRIEKEKMIAQVQHNHVLPENISMNEQRVSYEAVSKPSPQTSYNSLRLYDSVKEHDANFRQIIFGVNVNGQEYKIAVTKSLEGT